jgi:hypothetical protein
MAWLFSCFVALVIVVALGGLVVFLLWLAPNWDPDEKKSPHILQYGQKVRAFLVMPPPQVYQEGWPGTMCQRPRGVHHLAAAGRPGGAAASDWGAAAVV